MKPAFPAVVYLILICWTIDADPIRIPHIKEWSKRDLIYALSFPLRIFKSSGRSTTKPMHILIPLYINGPMASAAWLWKAKVNPQIRDAVKSNNTALFSFIGKEYK